MDYITDSQIDQVAGDIGNQLRAEPKIRFTIAPKDDKDRMWIGGIGGAFFRIPVDTEVELPESLYLLIRANRRVTKAAEAEVEEYTRGKGKKLA